jgi:hypothetical protein
LDFAQSVSAPPTRGILSGVLCLVIQAALALPNTVGAFSGVPGYSGPAAIVLEMRTHTVYVQVGQTFQDVKSVSQIKNTTKETGEITIILPNCIRNASAPPTPEAMQALEGVLQSVKATWDGQPVAFRSDNSRQNETVGDPTASFDSRLIATVAVKPEATHNLTIEYRSKAGSTFAAELQTFAYDTRYVSKWKGRMLGHIAVALRYQQLPNGLSAVFAVDSTYPADWQVGNAMGEGQQGAYFGAKPFAAGERPITFTYYAGGF